MEKKGYMFIVDALVAIVVLVIGLSFILYDNLYDTTPYYNTEQLSEDVVGVLFETQIKDMCINPGIAGCDCGSYKKLEDIVCVNNVVNNYDNSLLGMISEVIESKSVDKIVIRDIIKEIFVEKKVIDEKRFGFSLIYTDRSSGAPLELYNTESES